MKNKLTKGLIVQTILVTILVVVMIISIFKHNFIPYADYLTGLTFMVMSYNKRKDYSKSIQIMLYLLGLLFIGLGIFYTING